MRKNKNREGSIIVQVAILFLICVALIGIITQLSQYYRSERYVTSETESRAERIASEVTAAVKEYPAYKWLLNYWYEHADEMSIEYDVDFVGGKETKAKEKDLLERNPGFSVRYAQVDDIYKLSEEDQKLYAEIAYSWLITRVNQIKRVHRANYLFCVQTEPPYTGQFFMFSAADPGAVRGTEYEQVYTLGVTVEVSESQQEAMRSAVSRSSHIAEAGNYVDYYSYMDKVNEHDILIGLTYDQSGIMNSIRSETLMGTLIAMGYQILLSIVCLLGILFFVLKPLKKVQETIRIYKDTKDSAEVERNLADMHLDNEIGELASDVRDLSKEIDEYLEEISVITAERERMGTELALAEQIQLSTLPHTFPPFPERDDIDIYAVMDPAREVGGDFYDFFFVDDDHLCIVIADVSGKGIPAALFMMISKIIVKNYTMLRMNPSEVLNKANEIICAEDYAEMFVTVWIGILEVSTGRLIAANAGHEYPAVKGPDGKFELLKDKHGFVVGGLDGMNYKEYELTLEPGSKVFVYTDGVPEAANPEEELFGTDRMIDALNSDPDASPEQILRNVRIHIDDFVRDAEQFDDMTMLCLDYRGPQD